MVVDIFWVVIDSPNNVNTSVVWLFDFSTNHTVSSLSTTIMLRSQSFQKNMFSISKNMFGSLFQISLMLVPY
jgi:hypothetical protein